MLPQVDSYTKESYNQKAKMNVFDLVSYEAIYEQIENASPDVKAYEIGVAIALKTGTEKASEVALCLGEGLQAYCVKGSVVCRLIEIPLQ